jgi:hypothetical protein
MNLSTRSDFGMVIKPYKGDLDLTVGDEVEVLEEGGDRKLFVKVLPMTVFYHLGEPVYTMVEFMIISREGFYGYDNS